MTVFPNGWKLTQILGEGSYGTVYLARRTLGRYTEEAAIKHISIPKNESELNMIREEHGPEESSVLSCLDEIRDQIVGEYQQMHLLQGHTNIVACHDIECCPKQDGPGYDIYIRMELLESVSSRITAGKMNREETIKLGMDICRALMLLSQQEPGIIHRDIKPQNLFVNANGDYKLGDFGTARSIAGTSALMSVKGTYAFMAPEVMNNQPVSFAADIYSLGLVMYRLMNENRAPFVTQGQGGSLAGSEASNMKRLQGVQLPAPVKADRELADIILKACAFEPQDRWQSAEAMLNALELLTGRTVERHDASSRTTGTVKVDNNESTKEIESHKKNKYPVHSVIVLVACLVLLVAGIYLGIRFLPEVQEWLMSDSKIEGDAAASLIPPSEPVPSPTPAPVEKTVGDYVVLIYANQTCEIIGYVGSERDIHLPAVIDECTVVRIADNAFWNNNRIKSIYIPGSVKSIGTYAFYSCDALVRVELSDGVEVIQASAFRDCAALCELVFPTTLIAIEDLAFRDCISLVEVSIPDSNIRLARNPFRGCRSLTAINVSISHPTLAVSDGMLYDRTERRVICYPMGLQDATVIIPDGIQIIGTEAFIDCDSIVSIDLPHSVKKIGGNAFNGCYALSEVTIPEGVEFIGDGAFYNCSSLRVCYLPASVNTIENGAFAYCQELHTLVVDAGNPSYYTQDNVLFSRNGVLLCYPAGLKTELYIIPNSVVAISPRAFDACYNLQEVVIPNSVSSIGDYAFRSCHSLKSVVIPKSLVELGDGAFSFCISLTGLTVDPENAHYYSHDNVLFSTQGELLCYPAGIKSDLYCVPDSIVTIGDRAFGYGKVSSVVIPEGVEHIQDYAFYNSQTLISVQIPASVIDIGTNTFRYCPNLTLIVPENSYAYQYAVDNKIPYQIN